MAEEEPKPPNATSSLRRAIAAMGGVVLAVVLLVWVMQVVQLTGSELQDFLAEHWLPLTLVSFVSIGLQSWFSALKWRHLSLSSGTRKKRSADVSRMTLYTSTATLLAQFLPSPIAVPIVRGLATRFDFDGTFTEGAAITVYDQLFDVGVLLFVAIACLGLFLLGATPAQALAVTLSGLALMLIIGRWVFARVRILAITRAVLPSWFPWRARVNQALDAAEQGGLDSAESCAVLIRLSILRYLSIGIRSVGALIIAAPGLSYASAAWGFGIVQASSLAAITPGNIGVTEWGWAAIEVLLRAETGIFVLAILAHRIVSIPATIAVALCALLSGKVSQRP